MAAFRFICVFPGFPVKSPRVKVHIPNSAFLGNINGFFSTLTMEDPDRLEITSNPRWISVHPLVLAMIGALGKPLDPRKITCEPILAPSGHYLKRMGLFEFIGINPEVKDITEHEAAGRFIPLTQVKTSNDLDRFLKELVPLLHIQSEPKRVRAIQHIFSELIRNVLEHSDSPHGAVVCAQFFKSSNRIAIGVADNGKGLKASLEQSHSVTDDLQAIKLALTPGITGTTAKPGGTAQNAGFGLFLIKSIAYVGYDFFTIISGQRIYKLLQRSAKTITLKADPFADRHSVAQVPAWKGVAVGVDISLDQTDEFTSLLDTIYRFYSSAVKGQNKRRYKKPRFI